MRGQIEINGWSFLRKTKIRPGLFSSLYQNREGWKAQEIFSGRNNQRMGLLVTDEQGKSQGLVQTIQELP